MFRKRHLYQFEWHGGHLRVPGWIFWIALQWEISLRINLRNRDVPFFGVFILRTGQGGTRLLSHWGLLLSRPRIKRTKATLSLAPSRYDTIKKHHYSISFHQEIFAYQIWIFRGNKITSQERSCRMDSKIVDCCESVFEATEYRSVPCLLRLLQMGAMQLLYR